MSDDVTIGTCWDADRLDLGRVSIKPEAKHMSTAYARDIAAQKSMEQFLAREGARSAALIRGRMK